MNKALMVVVLIGLQGCAYKDPIFQPYVDQVIQYCDEYKCGKQQRINEISISFGDINQSDDGHCGLNGITIKPDAWNNGKGDAPIEDYRLMLIFHELGHCAFRKIDIFDKNPNGFYPIMYSLGDVVADYWQYDQYKTEMLDDFFKE